MALAVVAAATAGALALLVTAARLPLLGSLLSPEAFYKALVGHVTFALVVWLLSGSVAVALYRARSDPPDHAVCMAGLGAAAMVAGLFLPGRPVVVDYLPYVDAPLYVFGYGLFAAGTGAALWGTAWRNPACAGRSCMAVAYAASLVALLLGLARAGGTSPQAAVWGAGHALQFVYVTALALSWYDLAGAREQPDPALTRLGYATSAGLAWIPAVAYLVAEPSTLPRWGALNLATGLALSVPTFLHLVVLAPRVLRAGGMERAALRWSVGLYLLGGLLAPVGAANTLRVTAHYHAMLVGGVTTAFMAAAYRILEHEGLPVQKEAGRLQVHLFGAGVLLTVAALLVAAGHGLPRKAYLSGPHPWSLPVVLLGLAAAVSAAGGAWFLSCAWRALRHPRTVPAGHGLPVPTGGR